MNSLVQQFKDLTGLFDQNALASKVRILEVTITPMWPLKQPQN